MWTEDVASFDGEFVSLEPSWCWPKPVQEPGPKVYLGGSGPVTMKHAAEWADTWYPTPPMADPFLETSIPKFKAMLEEAGRDPESVPVGVAPGSCDEAGLEAYPDQRRGARQHRAGRGHAGADDGRPRPAHEDAHDGARTLTARRIPLTHVSI